MSSVADPVNSSDEAIEALIEDVAGEVAGQKASAYWGPNTLQEILKIGRGIAARVRAEAVAGQQDQYRRGYDQGYGDATDRAMQDVAEAVAEERRRIAAAIRQHAGPEVAEGICAGVQRWPVERAKGYTAAISEVIEEVIGAAGPVPVATPAEEK